MNHLDCILLIEKHFDVIQFNTTIEYKQQSQVKILILYLPFYILHKNK